MSLAMASQTGSGFVKENNIDPSQYDATMKKLLIGQGAEKYVNIFRQHNIGQSTLTVLTDDDLIKLGVDDSKIRNNIINMVKDLPIYEELSAQKPTNNNNLSLKEITEILLESSDHLNRVYMSLYSTTKALSKEGVSDTLLYEDKYASDIAISTIGEITNILDSMEHVLQTKMMSVIDFASGVMTAQQKCIRLLIWARAFDEGHQHHYKIHGMVVHTGQNLRKKKIIVGTVGSVLIVTLAVLFAKSLKQLNTV